MKLRLRNNSIRLRLLQNEVQQLKMHGLVEESINFNLNPLLSLTYILQTNPATTEITADFADAKIIVGLPLPIAEKWITGNEISLHGAKEIGSGATLKILIEKDFVCLDRRDDPDNADAFPHPAAENCAEIK